MSAISFLRIAGAAAATCAWLLPPVPLRAQGGANSPNVLITSTVTTDKQRQAGHAGTDADAGASLLENLIGQELMKKFPCSTNVRPSELGAMIEWERWKELLGAGDPDALANIAGSVGADYIVYIRYTESAGTVYVTASTIDSRTGRAVSNTSTSFKMGGDPVTALESFAGQFAAGFAGPRCSGKGSFKVVISKREQGKNAQNGNAFTTYAESVLACTLDLGPGGTGDGTCTLNESSGVDGSGATLKTVIQASDAAAHGSITVANGKVGVSVSGFNAKKTISSSFGGGTENTSVGPFSFTAPGTARSGSWSDGKGMTISWSLPNK